VVEAMARAATGGRSCVDGGAAAMDLLLQLQADQLGVTVRRPVDQETTALGAAYLAGLAEGVWGSLDEIAAAWQEDAEFRPADDRTPAEAGYQTWLRGVERSRAWAAD
jgi:glycerol kinase